MPPTTLLRTRHWVSPAAISALFVASGLAWSIGIPGLEGHPWVQSGDLWAELRTAHYVGWGDFGDVYSAAPSLLGVPSVFSFPPAWFVLLAPAAMLCSRLSLTEGVPIPVAHPSAWPVLLCYSLLCSCVAVFGFHRLAGRLGWDEPARTLATLAGSAVIWPVVAVSGHPEDAVALGLCLFALVAALGQRLSAAAWLLGFAIGFQSYSVLVVAVVAGFLPWGKLPGFIARSAAFPLALVAVPLAADWNHASLALLSQPSYPALGWPTPWIEVARRIPISSLHWYHPPAPSPGRLRPPTTASHHMSPVPTAYALPRDLISSSSIRVFALATAAAAGAFVRRRRPDQATAVWIVGVVLVARCWFEAVMLPYYVLPGLAVLAFAGAAHLSPAASRRGIGRFAINSSAVVATSIYTFHHGPLWRWFVLFLVATAAACYLTRPRRTPTTSSVVDSSRTAPELTRVSAA